MGEGLAGTWEKGSESKEPGGGHGAGRPRRAQHGALRCALRGLWVQGEGGEQEEGTDGLSEAREQRQ